MTQRIPNLILKSVKTGKKVKFSGCVIPMYNSEEFLVIIELRYLTHGERCQAHIILKEKIVMFYNNRGGAPGLWVTKIRKTCHTIAANETPVLNCDCVWINNLEACEEIEHEQEKSDVLENR